MFACHITDSLNSCLADPADYADCLAILTVYPVHCTHSRQGVSRDAGRKLQESQELQPHLLSPDWHSNLSNRHAVFSPFVVGLADTASLP